MNKIDRLTKEHPESSINLIELLRQFDPSDSGKFTLFLWKRLIEQIEEHLNKINKETNLILDIIAPNANIIKKYFTLILYYALGRNNLYALWELDHHLNNKRVEKKDIRSYKSWDDVINNVITAELKLEEKKLRKEIEILYKTNEWIVIKPLSFIASLAYGAGTKWCTASKNNPYHFYDYSYDGILIYIINKRTGYKAAMSITLNQNNLNDPIKEITFWNNKGKYVDSIELNIPNEIMNFLRNFINDKTKLKPNKDFFSEHELNKMKKYYNDFDFKDDFIDQEDDEDTINDTNYTIEYVNNLDSIDEEQILSEFDNTSVNLDSDETDSLNTEPNQLTNQSKLIENADQIKTNNDVENITSLYENNNVIDTENKITQDLVNKLHQASDDNILDFGIPNIVCPKEFKPAPWLTQHEIDLVNLLLQQKLPTVHGQKISICAYPNGRVIKLIDTIQNDIIVKRNIEEIRPGRDQHQRFNPFGIMRKGEFFVKTQLIALENK